MRAIGRRLAAIAGAGLTLGLMSGPHGGDYKGIWLDNDDLGERLAVLQRGCAGRWQ